MGGELNSLLVSVIPWEVHLILLFTTVAATSNSSGITESIDRIAVAVSKTQCRSAIFGVASFVHSISEWLWQHTNPCYQWTDSIVCYD